jgi:hypothetical protein
MPETDTRICGFDDVDRAFYQEYFSVNLPSSLGKPRFVIMFNLVLLISAMARSAFWILRRIRFSPPLPKKVFMGSDYVGGNHDTLLWSEVVDGGGDVMVVMRNTVASETYAETMGSHSYCQAADGIFSLSGGLAALRQMVRHCLGLFRRGYQLPTDFFRKLIILPHKRIVYRALFNRYHFSYFWSRDEYNSDHIMRSQELRKAGGVSMGIMHGIASICILAHQFRYLDFDRVYVLGRDQYERLYYQTWPSHTTVRAIGSFGVTREEMERLKKPRPKNVACFISPSFHEEAIMAGIEDIARRFPDRKFFINVKGPGYLKGTFGEALSRFLKRGPDNLIFDKRRSYELLFDCQFVINESSTLAAEAAQLGLFSFILDPTPGTKNLYYRQVPEICLESSSEIATRIRQIEAGNWRYPRELFSRIINLTGHVSWDLIRADMGLPPKNSKPLAHLAFVTEDNPIIP